MSHQAFGGCKRNAWRRNAFHPGARYLLAANDADEVEHAEASTPPSHRTRGQYVIRSGNVVSRGLRCELVKKNRAGMLDCRNQRRRYREMLGSYAIRYLDCLLQRSNQKNSAATG